MAEYKKWEQFPGFVDPYKVVHYCVSLLSRDVYPNMEYTKFDIETTKAKLKEPCDGIKIYLQDLPTDPEVTKEVRYYINHPCPNEMSRIINRNSRKALQFMLEYLKLRGSLIIWKIDGSASSLNSLTKVRCIIRFANCFMEALPELDYCACVCLGKYLHYLLSVCYAHEMFYMKDIISKLYGPVFIEILATIKNSETVSLSPAKSIDYSIYIFKHMLESCPWNQMSPTETLKRTIYPSNYREFSHKYCELADHITHTYTLPADCQENVAKQLYQQRMNCSSPEITTGIDRQDSLCYIPSDQVHQFPPDKCKLDFASSSVDPAKIIA